MAVFYFNFQEQNNATGSGRTAQCLVLVYGVLYM